jgi:sugar phosphate isomerase/epimerase
LVHIKDIAAGSEFEDAPVGEGIVDWAPILAAARDSGAEWYIIEQDRPKYPIADVATSLDHLTRMLATG